jgi:predicted esterase
MKKKMKNTMFMLRIIGLLVIVFCIACNCKKKVEYDYSGIFINQYYKARISDTETMFLFFSRADSLLQGEYFLHTGKAIAKTHAFDGYTKKRHTIIHFHSDEGIRKTKGNIHTSGDTVVYDFGTRKHPSQYELIRIREARPQIMKPRYNSPVFSKVRKRVLTYGNAKGYYTSKKIDKITPDRYPSIIADVGKSLAGNIMMRDLPLELDLYQPIGDTLKKRPLIVLIHGGAFVIGDKDSETMVSMAEYFAKRGFVAASINYRIGYMFLPGGYSYLERCMYRAVQDARAAIRYLVHHAPEYGIDPSYIFVAGNSAGGFTALKTAFMEQHEAFASASGNSFLLREDLGCLDCSGNTYKTKFKISGVINMWGALTDTALISKKENIPVLSFHGDADQIVPPNHQYPFANVGTEFSSFFSQKTHGSVMIDRRMKNLSLISKLVLFPGADHDPQVDAQNKLNEIMDMILTESEQFLFNIISSDSTILKGKGQVSLQDDISSFELKGKGSIRANWSVLGGRVISTSSDGRKVNVVWFANAPEHKIHFTAINENGLLTTGEQQIRLTNE